MRRWVILLAATAVGCGGRVAAPTRPAGPTSAGSPPASSPAVGRTAAAWPTYHLTPDRGGFDRAAPPAGALRPAWTRRLDGAVYAEPLVVDGLVVAATESDTVYALDPNTGAVRWRDHLGSPVQLSQLPCGDIDPLGITGTPVYDHDRIYLVAEVTGPRHLLFALDPVTGAVRWSRPVDPPGADPTVQQQRAALLATDGRVYVGFGGLYGDCGAYHGYLVSAPESGTGPLGVYQVPAVKGGIWSPAGPVLGPNGDIYAAVGNGTSTTGYDGSDSVLQLSPGLRLLSLFAPASWARDNAADLDLGSSSPVLLPGGRLVADGKSGVAYLLSTGRLPGVGTAVPTAPGCRSYGGAAVLGSVAFLPCAGGLGSLLVGPGDRLRWQWFSSPGPADPPVVAGGLLWAVDAATGQLDGVDPATGAVRTSASLPATPHFATPTVAGSDLVVGTLTGVTAFLGA